MYTLVSSLDEWDTYEGLQWYASENYARAHPDDPRIALPARPAPGDRDVRDDDRDADASRAR